VTKLRLENMKEQRDIFRQRQNKKLKE